MSDITLIERGSQAKSSPDSFNQLNLMAEQKNIREKKGENNTTDYNPQVLLCPVGGNNSNSLQ